MHPRETDPHFLAFQRDWQGGPDCAPVPDEPDPDRSLSIIAYAFAAIGGCLFGVCLTLAVVL